MSLHRSEPTDTKNGKTHKEASATHTYTRSKSGEERGGGEIREHNRASASHEKFSQRRFAIKSHPSIQFSDIPGQVSTNVRPLSPQFLLSHGGSVRREGYFFLDRFLSLGLPSDVARRPRPRHAGLRHLA